MQGCLGWNRPVKNGPGPATCLPSSKRPLSPRKRSSTKVPASLKQHSSQRRKDSLTLDLGLLGPCKGCFGKGETGSCLGTEAPAAASPDWGKERKAKP